MPKSDSGIVGSCGQMGLFYQHGSTTVKVSAGNGMYLTHAVCNPIHGDTRRTILRGQTV